MGCSESWNVSASVNSFANSACDQEPNADQAAQTDHTVANPEGRELSRVVCRLEGCQKTEHAEGGDGQKENRTRNGEKNVMISRSCW
jgi:hypothetical protein